MAKTHEEAMRELQAEMDGVLQEARAAFEGIHGESLKKLQGLSEADLATLVPNVDAHADYAALLGVVRKASAGNMATAELQKRIRALGANAVAIAKKVGLLA